MADGAMFFPPAVMIRSFFLPVTRRKPCGIDLAQIPGELPAALDDGFGGFFGHLVILFHHVAAAEHDLPVFSDPLLDPGPREPDPAEAVVVDPVDVGKGGVLAHPDAFQNQNTGGVKELGDGRHSTARHR